MRHALPLALLAAATLLPAATGSPAPARPPAAPAPLPPVLGEPSSDLVLADDTLLDVAYRHRLGFEAVARLNPGLHVWIPEPGQVVRLPTQYILPDEPWRGIVVNIPEMRLYDFTVSRGAPEVFAIAIGDEVDPSLHGEFKVGAKREDPAWHVPESIRLEKPELPEVVPPGPDNPLGDRWMTIGTTSYGIHGTNNAWSIGRMATHGCIRLYEDEMRRLYARIPTGTRLRIDYQPVKLGQLGGGIYVEAHPDLYSRAPEAASEALARLEALGLLAEVDVPALERAVREARGVPVRIGDFPGAPGGSATSTPAS
jgi:L,D-transpeptidase ErfK/SrfK